MILGNRENISKLFSIPVQYKVPHYQRRYVWDKTNWCKLSEDILARLGLELKGDMDSGFDFEPIKKREDIATINDKKHFTGIIVARKIRDGEPEEFEVIDGQQRLTTFQVIFCVIRDIFKSNRFDIQAGEPENLIKGSKFAITYQKFIPTNYDRNSFQRIYNGTYSPSTSRKSEKMIRNILDTYDYFYKWILCYVQKNGSENETIDNEKLGDLFSTIKTNFDCVRLTLEKNDNSEEIFESLNATGRKLSDFDYLRNNLFLRAGKLGNDPNGKSYSEIFYEKYWKFEQDGPYHWKTDKQEKFLQAFLKKQLGSNCFSAENEKPFDVYRKYSRTVANGIKDEFEQLYAYAKSYRNSENNEDT